MELRLTFIHNYEEMKILYYAINSKTNDDILLSSNDYTIWSSIVEDKPELETHLCKERDASKSGMFEYIYFSLLRSYRAYLNTMQTKESTRKSPKSHTSNRAVANIYHACCLQNYYRCYFRITLTCSDQIIDSIIFESNLNLWKFYISWLIIRSLYILL